MEQKIKAMQDQTRLQGKVEEAFRASATADRANKVQATSKRVVSLKV